MKKVEEYCQNAAECREVARTDSPVHRLQLEEMAETWERLAQADGVGSINQTDAGSRC